MFTATSSGVNRTWADRDAPAAKHKMSGNRIRISYRVYRLHHGGSTAFLIELVNYPGSTFSFWPDDVTATPIPPGAEKRIPVALRCDR